MVDRDPTNLMNVVIAHVASVLLPVLGPLLIVLIVRRDRWARSHALVALTVSTASLAAASAIGWIRDASTIGTSDGGGLSGWTVVLASLLGLTMLLAVVNIGRAKQTRCPLGIRSC